MKKIVSMNMMRKKIGYRDAVYLRYMYKVFNEFMKLLLIKEILRII